MAVPGAYKVAAGHGRFHRRAFVRGAAIEPHVTQAVIALATEDFEAYLDLSRQLRAAGVPFETHAPDGPIPGHVSVVITTAAEEHRVPHDRVVVYTTPEATVEDTVRSLKGLTEVRQLVLGIDPGERPGLAVVADGHTLSARQTEGPAALLEAVEDTAARYPEADVLVRVGHGAVTLRDGIVNALLASAFDVELVDETSTSPPLSRKSGERDAVAARAIAAVAGARVTEPLPVHVSLGEIREVQRRSRIASGGLFTINRRLALKVATGRLTLTEAVRRHRMNDAGRGRA